jgi:RNA polymerase sigma-70 factor (ECF subfamily)
MKESGKQPVVDHPLKDAFSLHHDGIFRFIYSRTFNSALAEDLAGQVFLKAVENWEKFDPQKGKVSTWLYTIARNLVTDHYKSAARRKTVADVWDFADEDTFVHDVEQKALWEEVKEAMKSLSADQRQVIILRIWHEMPYEEIASVMGKSEASLKMSYSRGITKLKDKTALLLVVLAALPRRPE